MISYAEQLYDELTANVGEMNEDTLHTLLTRIQKSHIAHNRGPRKEPFLMPEGGKDTSDALYEVSFTFLDGSTLSYKVAPDRQEPEFIVTNCSQ